MSITTQNGYPEVGFSKEFVATKEFMFMVSQTASLLDANKVEALLRELEQFETIGPIFDPTSFIRSDKSVKIIRELAYGFLQFRRAIEKAKEMTE